MSIKREDFSRIRYGVRVDDPDVLAAISAFRAMHPAKHAEWLRSVMCGYVAYQRTREVAMLTEVALDAAATLRMHRDPAYAAALDAYLDGAE